MRKRSSVDGMGLQSHCDDDDVGDDDDDINSNNAM